MKKEYNLHKKRLLREFKPLLITSTLGGLIGVSIMASLGGNIRKDNKVKNLEKDITKLEKEYEELQDNKMYDVSKLFVTEYDNHLYIITNEGYINDIYKEYHSLFFAFYNLHPDDKENHTHDFCPEYVHIYDGDIKLLIEYLDDDKEKEVASKGGKITTVELEEIEDYINEEYKKQNNKDVSKVKEYKYKKINA